MTAAADRGNQQAEAGDPRSRGTGSQPHLESVEGQAAQVGAATLLVVERRVRAAKDEVEIAHLIANELRRLVSGRQAIVLRLVRPDRFEVVGISSLVLSEKDTPFVRWLHRMVAALVEEHGRGQAVVFDLPAFTDPESPETRSYPFRHFVWQPLLLPAGEAFAGLLIDRERSWQSAECQLIAREAEAFANAWQALHGARAMRPRRRRGRWTEVLVAVGVVAAAACPVPMTVLAPVEIVADGPQRVTAPLDGVIKRILVEPNRRVQIGQPILLFDETALRNRHQVAGREMRLAEARYLRLGQAAFSDDLARHELACALRFMATGESG